MSLATEFAPVVAIPERAYPGAVEELLAGVTVLHAPSERSIAAPVRLTRRGVVVLAVTVLALGVAVVATAWLSAPGHPTRSPRPLVGDTVTVRVGDSLWTIATRAAPQRDPRAEVALLQRLNHLEGSALDPGQVLRIH